MLTKDAVNFEQPGPDVKSKFSNDKGILTFCMKFSS